MLHMCVTCVCVCGRVILNERFCVYAAHIHYLRQREAARWNERIENDSQLTRHANAKVLASGMRLLGEKRAKVDEINESFTFEWLFIIRCCRHITIYVVTDEPFANTRAQNKKTSTCCAYEL